MRPYICFLLIPCSIDRLTRERQGLGSLGGEQGGKVVGVSEEELNKLQDDADRREKQLKHQVRGW